MQITIGQVALFLVALYFVIKWAVREGINQSMLVKGNDQKKEEIDIANEYLKHDESMQNE